jgi:hypothetical protein
MKRTVIALSALTLASVFAGSAFADPKDHGRDGDRDEHRRHDDDRDQRGRYVPGHYEAREVRRVIPAVTREEWVPERREIVVIPAVTQEVKIPAVVERVWRPETRERVWVPETRERRRLADRIEVRFDRRGVDFSLGDDCVVTPAHYETRCIPAHYENVVVQPERCETRIVSPERREWRVVECAHMQTVVVCAERVECSTEYVWVPGCFEERRDRDDRRHG